MNEFFEKNISKLLDKVDGNAVGYLVLGGMLVCGYVKMNSNSQRELPKQEDKSY